MEALAASQPVGPMAGSIARVGVAYLEVGTYRIRVNTCRSKPMLNTYILYLKNLVRHGLEVPTSKV